MFWPRMWTAMWTANSLCSILREASTVCAVVLSVPLLSAMLFVCGTIAFLFAVFMSAALRPASGLFEWIRTNGPNRDKATGAGSTDFGYEAKQQELSGAPNLGDIG